MVSIKLLLFVMSAHSFKNVFYFLIIWSAFKNQSTEMWMNLFLRFDSILVSYQRLFQIQLMHLNWSAYYKRIDDTHSLSFHRWLCTNIEITSDILLQTYFMFSFYYFVFQLSMSLLIFNDFMLWICLLYFHITIDVLHLPCSLFLSPSLPLSLTHHIPRIGL